MNVRSDLTGGLDPDIEYFLAERPTDPEMRDSASLWVMDDSGKIGFPRITLDAIGGHWDKPWLQLNGVLADGRVLRLWEKLPAHSPLGPDGNVSILGAGPAEMRCVEPFRRWTMTFDGIVEQSTTAAQMAGETGGTPVSLKFHFNMEMAAPPWLMGGMTAEATRNIKSGTAGTLMGGVRYEQLCRVTGYASVDGVEYPISGTGMRVRRQGVRRMGLATGHCQHSALFPSGRAFGAIAFPPGADGKQIFNEGFVIMPNSRRVAARMIQAPWMTHLVASGDNASLTLQTQLGLIRIEGETRMMTFDQHLFEMAESSVLEQGIARYIWDGEETLGLIERCTLRDRLQKM
ncbi:hypothetical protein [Acidocella sp.]|uniref:hypothetical protein n=1 Tax=Acidocella sp. TaxID=50710 RepID=UPI0026118BB7|nr:hypothetical protein [Acidocella sp.]